jgi:hypothetical protein
MAWKPHLNARADREGEKREATRRRRIDGRTGATAASAEESLVRAAQTGRYAALVAAAQPAEPPKMVTPEENEAELRAKGQWPEEKPAPPAPAEPPAEPAPPVIEPGMPTEPTPGMKWAEEHLGKRPRGPAVRRPAHNPYRCLTEYNVLTGEIIGDGYIHYDGEDGGG